MRSFSSTSRVTARTGYRLPHNVQLKKPILPTINNLETSESHPLWQFFHDGQFTRPMKDLVTSGRPWAVSELRRKSYDDLHSLWYVCLKEINKLKREGVIYSEMGSTRENTINNIVDSILSSMKHIRHVLTERQASVRNAQSIFAHEKEQFLNEFKEEFLNASNEDVAGKEWQMKIERLCWGIWGKNLETLDASQVDEELVEAVEWLANMFWQKFNVESSNGDLKNIIECSYVLMGGRTEEGFKNALKQIEDFRTGGEELPKNKSVMALKSFFEETSQ